MPATQYTAEDLAAITASIASGVTATTINGRSVTFASMADLRAIRREIIAALRPSRPTAGTFRYTRGGA